MKLLLAVALVCAFVVGINGASERRTLFNINSLPVFSNNADTTTDYGVTILTKPTNYVADGTVDFVTTFNVTFSGNIPEGETPFLTNAAVSFSGPAPVYVFAAGCNNFLLEASPIEYYSNAVTYRTQGTVRLTDSSAPYTATASLYRGKVALASANFQFTVTTIFAPPNGGRPTVNSFTMDSPQDDIDVVLNVTLANTVAGNYDVLTAFTPVSSNQGVAWVTTCDTTVSVCDDWESLGARIGYWCGDNFISTMPANGDRLNGIDFQTGTLISVRSVSMSTVLNGNYYTNSVPSSSLNGNTQLVLNVGDTDSTPPDCSAVTFNPIEANTTDTMGVQITATIVCADSGEGQRYSGLFLRGTTSSGAVIDYPSNPQTTSGSSVVTFNVPPYVSGNIAVIGVWSIDGAANTVLYGECGDNADEYQTICGASNTSASSTMAASFAIVIACILALFAL